MALTPEECRAQLQARGFDPVAAAAKTEFYIACDRALDAMQAASPRVSVWAPGRIEVFGKHTDYAGGRSLLTAVDRGFCVRAAPRHDQLLRVRGYEPLGESAAVTCEIPLSAEATAPDGHWSNYVATVARRVAVNFGSALRGADIVFVSDLPQAAGASSSTALMISVFLSLAAVNRLDETPAWQASIESREDLAAYLGAMEMGGAYRALAGLAGVGTLGGSQDQTAILCAEAGHVVDYRWIPVRRVSAYALPASFRFVIANCGIAAEKSAGARERYNRVSLMVRHMLAAWNAEAGRADRSLAAAIESGDGAADRLRALLPRIATEAFTVEALRLRLEQFLLETYTLIPAAAQAFASHDWATLGAITARSQQAAEEWLGNQIAETSGLVQLAQAHGALAASAFGAGFGGSVWALVSEDAEPGGAAAFAARWEAAYRQRFPVAAQRAMFFTTAAGTAATRWADAGSP